MFHVLYHLRHTPNSDRYAPVTRPMRNQVATATRSPADTQTAHHRLSASARSCEIERANPKMMQQPATKVSQFERFLLVAFIATLGVLAWGVISAQGHSSPAPAQADSQRAFASPMPTPALAANIAANNPQPINFTLAAGQFTTIPLTVGTGWDGQAVKAQINVGDDIRVSVTGPSGQTLVQPARVSNGYIVQFASVGPGSYAYLFDNTYSILHGKQVSLRFIQ